MRAGPKARPDCFGRSSLRPAAGALRIVAGATAAQAPGRILQLASLATLRFPAPRLARGTVGAYATMPV